MNKEQHLTYFKVENFKRFDSLELHDIGQFNLIVGDNNVGKTSLLEALLVNFPTDLSLARLHKTLLIKGLKLLPAKEFSSKGEIIKIKYPTENFFNLIKKDGKENFSIYLKFLNNNVEHLNIEEAEFDSIVFKDPHPDNPDIQIFYKKNEIDWFSGKNIYNKYLLVSWLNESEPVYFEADENSSSDYFNGEFEDTRVIGLYEHSSSIDLDDLKLPLIYTSIEKDDYLAKLYNSQTQNSRKEEKEFLKNIQQVLLKNAEDISTKLFEDVETIFIGLEGVDKRLPITSFGESVVRATHILLEILKWRGQRLMIDEIDTGIHHSRLKEFLKTVFKVAQNNDVQLFMTTHSLECQQAFVEVFEDADMVDFQKDVRQFSLIETPEKQIVAQGFDFEQIQHALETGFDTRGGKRGW